MDSKAYAKEHKQAFIAKVVKGKVPVLEEKLAIFMAGTPGAGKTEVVESLIEEQKVVLNEASRRALIKQQEVIDLAESIDN